MLEAVKLGRTSDHHVSGVLVLILIGRLALHVLLYRSGFMALTADDFGRIVVAGQWAQQPHAIWQGPWLPLHTYVFGSLLRLDWDLLYLPRVISIGVGLGAIVLMYQLAARLFGRPLIGLLSAFLLAVNPVHLWLSSTPLTEGPYILLVLGAMSSMALDLEEHKPNRLYLSAVLLAFAGGIRFEGWLVSAAFSIWVLGRTLLLRRRGHATWLLVRALAVAGIPWLFPLVWLAGSYLHSGNAIGFLADVKGYKSIWYGQGRSYLGYLRTAFVIDPFLSVALIPSLLGYVVLYRRATSPYWYLVLTLIPLAIFGVLHGGQVEPPGNYLRYLAPFLLVFYPVVAFCCVAIVEFLARAHRWPWAGLAGLGVVITLVQINQALAFRNDPAAAGVRVGRRIGELLRTSGPEASTIMIELSYWDYLAIHVGANDLARIVYDRPVDLLTRRSESVLVSDLAVARGCLSFHGAGYVVVKSPELQAIVEQRLAFPLYDEVDGYRFYHVTPLRDEQSDGLVCPLGIGVPY